MQKMSQQNEREKEIKNLLCGFIGTGFIGTAMAEDFENRGYETIRYSLDKKYVKNKNKIRNCPITFIAVPTPSTPEGFDYSIVEDVLSLIGDGNIAVIKSTILPGTTEKLQKKFPLITVLHSPEFLTEKTAKKDAEYPTRNIVGYVFDSNYEAAEMVMGLLPDAPYKAIVRAEDAEMIKYANNCWFYFKVIYMNLLYDLCSKSEVSFETVKTAMSFDPRIGFTHLDVVHQGGRGAGGHCFIKDMAAFANLYRSKMPKDKIGKKLLSAMEEKNIELLLETGKNLDLLTGVYGNGIIK